MGCTSCYATRPYTFYCLILEKFSFIPGWRLTYLDELGERAQGIFCLLFGKRFLEIFVKFCFVLIKEYTGWIKTLSHLFYNWSYFNKIICKNVLIFCSRCLFAGQKLKFYQDSSAKIGLVCSASTNSFFALSWLRAYFHKNSIEHC